MTKYPCFQYSVIYCKTIATDRTFPPGVQHCSSMKRSGSGVRLRACIRVHGGHFEHRLQLRLIFSRTYKLIVTSARLL